MDPVGLAGTLIAIVQVSSKIVVACYEYHQSVKDALSDVTRIRDEATSVRNVAERLVGMAESCGSSVLPTLQALNSAGGPLEMCLRELDGLELLLTPKSKRSRMFVLKWPLNKPEAEKSLATMGRIKGTLQLALAADSVQNIGKIVDHVKVLPVIQDGVTSLVERSKLEERENEKAKFLQSLQAPSQESKLQEEFMKGVSGTGEWLINHHAYTQWKQEPNKLLWVHGMPGCGKTVLSSKVIKDLQGNCGTGSRNSLCYFFFDGSEQSSMNLESIQRSLVSQLISQCDRPLPYLGDIDCYLSKRGRRERQEEESRIMRYLEKVFREQREQFDHNYVVIDGLDECEDPDDLETIISSLTWLLDDTVHLIIFSRHLERLQLALEDVAMTQVAIEGEHIARDMRIALKAQLSAQRRFARWPASLKRDVESALLAEAQGCFRWLECQLLELKTCDTQGGVREALRSLPPSLYSHYTRVLEKMNPKNQVSVKNLLRWVTFSQRPISLQEVATAITINVESGGMPFVDEGLELFDVEDFLDSCSSLVSVHRGSSHALGKQEKYVQLAHYSVKEYLVSELLPGCLISWLPLEERLAHSSLARSCLAYILQLTGTEAEEFWDANPLASYAGRFMMTHKHLSSDDWNLKVPRKLLFDLFNEKLPYFQTWLKVAEIDRPWAKEKITAAGHKPSKYTPLYCAAWYGFENTTADLLADGASSEGSCGIYGNALQAAAINGYLPIVRLLIDAKVDVNAAGGRYKSAIATAAARGHLEIVRELHIAGADIQPQRRRFGDRRTDPLYLAVQYGSLDIVKYVLANGATDYWSMKANPVSALDAATQSGRLDIVKELLSHPTILEGNSIKRGCAAVIRSASSGFAASQCWAAETGQKEILRELVKHEMSLDLTLRTAAWAGDLDLVLECLNKGADIEASGRWDDPAALETAANYGHVEIVQELLARGAHPTSEALATAVRATENLSLVQSLVSAGADVNPPDGLPLHEAVRLGRLDMAELLVARGADMHKALQCAAGEGNYDGFTCLVKLGADLRRQDPEDGGPLLRAAAHGGSVAIVTHLLDSGIADDAPGDGDRTTTPLMEAIRSKNWDVMHLLSDRGANINAVPPERPQGRVESRWDEYDCYRLWPSEATYETALTLAARMGNEDACFHLISCGADVVTPISITAGTPLLYAIWRGMTELVNRLLLSGADANQQGTMPDRQKPSTPLLLAVEKRRVGIFHRLVAAGARIDDQDTEGFSPLHLAAAASSASEDDTDNDTGEGAENDTEILRALIHQYHAKVNDPRLLNGSQPIHSAAARGNVAQVRILLDAGATIDSLNDEGRTPLHWAAERGKWDVIDLLLEKGADPRIRSSDDNLQTALELAESARLKPVWTVPTIQGWDDAKIGELMKKLDVMTFGLVPSAYARAYSVCQQLKAPGEVESEKLVKGTTCDTLDLANQLFAIVVRKRKLTSDQPSNANTTNRALNKEQQQNVPARGDEASRMRRASDDVSGLESSNTPERTNRLDNERAEPASRTGQSVIGLTREIFHLNSQDLDRITTSALPDGGPEVTIGDLHHGISGPQRFHIHSVLGCTLPAEPIMRILLEDYFQSVHWFSLVILEPKFRAQFESISDGHAYPKQKPFLLVLAVVISLASWYRSKRASAAADGSAAQWLDWATTITHHVESQMFEIMDGNMVEHIQIKLLLGSYHCYHGRPKAAFALLGAAIKASQAIGLHREPTQGSANDIEERKRTWWTVYTWDRWSSITYGRPFGIDDKDCTITMPADIYENRRFVQDMSPELVCYSSYQRELNKLYGIASPVIKTIFSARPPSSRHGGTTSEAWYLNLMRQTHQKLKQWRSALPMHLAFNFDQDITLDASAAVKARRLQALSLQLTYDHLIIFFHRSLLAKQLRNLSQKDAPEIPTSPSQSSPAVSTDTASPAYQTQAGQGASSPEEWWEAALRTSRVTQSPVTAQLATDGHLVAFLGINLLNAAVVLVICALANPLTDRAQEAKRNITRVARLQEVLGKRSQLALQSSAVLRSMIQMILQKEAEAMLASVKPVEDHGNETLRGTSDEPFNFSVEDALRLPLTLSSDVHRYPSQATQYATEPYGDQERRLNESLATVQRVFTESDLTNALPPGNTVNPAQSEYAAQPEVGGDASDYQQNQSFNTNMHVPSLGMEDDWFWMWSSQDGGALFPPL